MNVYKSKPSQPLKYLFALLVFLLIMSITWTEVSGYESGTASVSGDAAPAHLNSSGNGNASSVPPTAVPEPGTIILLGSGLGAMYLMRKKRNKK